ncbi:MAG: transposase [Alphaproteobacteria bacterium]|jgi:hypothetical protein|nr:transposase [Alphaproteobacteria bacterium]
MNQFGFFDLPEHLHRLSAAGDPLEELGRIIDFEAFRPVLDEALNYADGSQGGRPPYDAVAMFKVVILAARNNVSDERCQRRSKNPPLAGVKVHHHGGVIPVHLI